MDITIVTRNCYPNSSAISTEVSAVVGGPFDEVRGWNVAFTLREGESRIIWLSAFLSLVVPVVWPVRVTNVGNGAYRVSRPFPWILRNGDKMSQAVEPATITGRTKYVAVVA
ncbi:MAG: hypothetical protein WBO35_02755 [Candidatus Saccharimonadales bacterium]